MHAIDKALRFVTRCGGLESMRPFFCRCLPANKRGGQRDTKRSARAFVACDREIAEQTSQELTAGNTAAVRPQLYGIAHLSCDEQGRVYWRGEWVDRWSSELLESEAGRLLAETLALGCLIVEDRGQCVSEAAHRWRKVDLATLKEAKVRPGKGAIC